MNLSLTGLPGWAQRWSVWVLIAANLVPLGGVLFAGWSAFEVVFLYWLENLIIGFFNIGKMLTVGAIGFPAQGELPPSRSPLAARLTVLGVACFYAGFFTIHYGLFTNVHGTFVFVLLAPELRESLPQGSGLWEGIFLDTFYLARQGIMSGFFWSFLTLFVSHGFSFIYNFLYCGEYRRVGLPQLMMAPYGRVLIMHVTVLLGAAAAMLLGAPASLVALLVLLKTGVDVAFHVLERRKGAIAPGQRDRADAGPNCATG